MNLSIDRSMAMAGNFHVVIGNKKKAAKKENAEVSPEQRMIDQFKETHSKENTKQNEIYNKFRSGKKLTSEELEYLAKESPEMYRQVKEIIAERQAMEAQMEKAETKEEVAEIHLNQVCTIKKTMGTGEEAERQAEKTMARVNQIDSAYCEFTATLEYKEKEDVKSRTEEQREDLRELEEEIEEYAEEIAEKSDENAEENVPLEEKPDVEEGLDSDETGHRIKYRRKSRKESLPPGNELFRAQIDIDDLRRKVREMYRTERRAAAGVSGSAKRNGIDISL